jgi:hypothetical protein
MWRGVNFHPPQRGQFSGAVDIFKPPPAGDGPDCVRTACAAATLPLCSPAAARLWAAGHAPARGSWATSSTSHPRWPQIVLHDHEESTPLRAPIPPVATLAAHTPIQSVVG